MEKNDREIENNDSNNKWCMDTKPHIIFASKMNDDFGRKKEINKVHDVCCNTTDDDIRMVFTCNRSFSLIKACVVGLGGSLPVANSSRCSFNVINSRFNALARRL